MSIKTCIPLACIVVTVIFNPFTTPPTPNPPTPPPVIIPAPTIHVPHGCVRGELAIVNVAGPTHSIEYRGHAVGSVFGVHLHRGQHKTISVVVNSTNGKTYTLSAAICRRGPRRR